MKKYEKVRALEAKIGNVSVLSVNPESCICMLAVQLKLLESEETDKTSSTTTVEVSPA